MPDGFAGWFGLVCGVIGLLGTITAVLGKWLKKIIRDAQYDERLALVNKNTADRIADKDAQIAYLTAANDSKNRTIELQSKQLDQAADGMRTTLQVVEALQRAAGRNG